MGTFVAPTANCIIRGALMYVAWCYGGFVVGPLAVAWDRMFAIPLWVIVAAVALVPLVVEAGVLWVSQPRERFDLDPALSLGERPFASGGAPAVLPHGWAQRRLRRVRSRARNPMERFGRPRMR